MKKRLFAVLLFACIGVISFAGCSTDIIDKATVVRVWTNDGGGKSTWMKLVDEFNRTEGKEKNIRREWSTFSGEYPEVVKKAQKSGKLPEILSLWGSASTQCAQTGEILPLSDFEGGEDIIKEYDAITAGRTKRYDGKVYSLYSTSNVAGLIYNKDLFREAGIVDENGEPTPPETFAEMREYAKKITDREKNIYGYSYPMSFAPEHVVSLPVATSARIRYDYENLVADVSEYRPIFETLYAMKNDGSLFPGAEKLDNDTSRAYFAEGKIGMMSGISWDVGVLTTQFVARCDWGVAPFPTADGLKKYPAWHDISGSFFLSSNAKKVEDEKIMTVYRFLFSRKARMAIYENNVRLSCMTDIMQYADKSKLRPQFISFTEIFDDTYTYSKETPTAIQEFSGIWKKVWDGEITLDEMFERWNKLTNENIKNSSRKEK